MNSIRAAFYARVSSEQQATAHTIESQLTALVERAQADGSPVPLERQFVDYSSLVGSAKTRSVLTVRLFHRFGSSIRTRTNDLLVKKIVPGTWLEDGKKTSSAVRAGVRTI